MIVDKNSHIPVYCQLKEYLLDGIKKGIWIDEIPSERQLCEKAEVTRMTVRQALGDLVNDGVLYRIKGKGTFISKSKIEQMNIMSFSEILFSKGLIPITKVLEFEENYYEDGSVPLNELNGEKGFYRLKRLRCAGNLPVGIEENFIPKVLFPNFQNNNLENSLYTILKAKYNQLIEEMDVSINADMPTEKEIQYLSIKKHTPVLRVEGNSISSNGVALIYERDCYISNRFSYKVSVLNNR